jgi:hypothetical protein
MLRPFHNLIAWLRKALSAEHRRELAAKLLAELDRQDAEHAVRKAGTSMQPAARLVRSSISVARAFATFATSGRK